MPTTSMPFRTAVLTTARITALSPGQSPPPVRIPMHLTLEVDKKFDLFIWLVVSPSPLWGEGGDEDDFSLKQNPSPLPCLPLIGKRPYVPFFTTLGASPLSTPWAKFTTPISRKGRGKVIQKFLLLNAQELT